MDIASPPRKNATTIDPEPPLFADFLLNEEVYERSFLPLATDTLLKLTTRWFSQPSVPIKDSLFWNIPQPGSKNLQ